MFDKGAGRRSYIFQFCLALISTSCAVHHSPSFKVLPQTPNDVLRSPDHHETPFPDVLRDYNGFEAGRGWIDLGARMDIRIENAYYEKGASRKGLQGFLGTEVASYQIGSHGLRLLSVRSMKDRPQDELAVERLISPGQMKFRYYRLYFEIVFARKTDEHGSVLLGADSIDDLTRLSTQLSNPETVCGSSSTHCTTFPEACSVSVEIEIQVNGQSQVMDWGSLLSSIVTDQPSRLEMKRLFGGRLAPVKIGPQDSQALRLPLLPGDQIVWKGKGHRAMPSPE